jgi:asparagine synthase (glutamine-hydrolysing)
MCGIAGKLTAGEPVDHALLERMADALAHRGPDSRGLHVDGPVGLAMRRLAVIDPAGGDQPLYSEDRRIVCVCNGEIYNHVELRDELRRRGHRFAGGSDAEVIVHLYEELGAACVTRLRGMFAFAVWDASANELLLVRDRIGKKPLYWTQRSGTFWFGSEPRAILQDPRVPRDVDPEALDAFLVNQYVPDHLCAFSQLHKLPPASTLHWRPGGEPRIERYWHIDRTQRLDLELDEAAEALREQLLEATRLRLRSDVPLGAFLSGGIDSSVVVAAMARQCSQPVRTFAIAFPGWDEDERPHARRVAEHLGTEHHEVEIGPVDVGLLPRIAWHFGEPFADPAALPTFQLAELTRQHVTVALSGDGGDELFAGYRRYRQLALTRVAERLPRRMRSLSAQALGVLAGSRSGRAPLPRAARLAMRLAQPPALRYGDLMRFFGPADRERLYGPLLRPMLAAGSPQAHLERAWEAAGGVQDWVERTMALDLDTYLPDDLLTKLDRTSMAHALEVRSPLLDHHLVEFAAALPRKLKLDGGIDKLVLRKAAEPWLPAATVAREKQGLGMPLGRWLRNELRDLPEALLLDDVARGRGLFEPTAVEAVIAEHRAGTSHLQQLWAMIALELWYRTCVDVPLALPSELPVLA